MFKKDKEWLLSLDRDYRSYVCNLIYWNIHYKYIDAMYSKQANLSFIVKSVSDIKTYMNKFVYTKDYIDWEPWIITVLHKQLKDDCDGASVLSKYLFKIIGIQANIYELYGEAVEGHTVTVTSDNKYMVSNSDFYNLSTNISLQSNIINIFNNQYVHFNIRK